MTRGWRRHLPALTWSLVLLVLFTAPGEDLPDPGLWDWLDKPLHGLAFAVHCALLARSLAGPGERALAMPMVLSGLYGLLLELVQIGIPGRSWDWWDLLADFIGIAVAALLVGRSRARLRGTP